MERDRAIEILEDGEVRKFLIPQIQENAPVYVVLDPKTPLQHYKIAIDKLDLYYKDVRGGYMKVKEGLPVFVKTAGSVLPAASSHLEEAWITGVEIIE